MDSVESVKLASLVCWSWREFVYGRPWRFCGYLHPGILRSFPSLAAPEAFFLVPDSYQLHGASLKENPVIPGLLRWVQERNIKKLRIQVTGYYVLVEEIFKLFLDAGVEDLLVRHFFGSYLSGRNPWGFWYQKGWTCEGYEGSGRLVMDCEGTGGMWVNRLQPLYLVASGDEEEFLLSDGLPSCVKILGIQSDFKLYKLRPESTIEEVRVLRPNPLNPWKAEQYDVLSGDKIECMVDCDPVPSVRRFRGGVPSSSTSHFFHFFPNVSEVAVRDAYRFRRPPFHPILSLEPRDPRTKPFAPPLDLETFWSLLPRHVFQIIESYLAFSDVMRMVQLFGGRSLVTRIPTPTIPLESLTKFDPSVIFHGLITVSTEMEVRMINSWSSSLEARNIHVIGDDSLMLQVLKSLSETPVPPYTGHSYRLRISFSHEPASILIDKGNRIATLHLPIRFQEWNKKFSKMRLFGRVRRTSDHPWADGWSEEYVTPTCHFY